MSDKIQRNYVSEVDQFLKNFDEAHPAPSASQLKEINKYKRIYALRDSETPPVETKSIWEKF